jgi:hypothetical protein
LFILLLYKNLFKKSIEERECDGEDWTNQKFYDIILIENKK